MVSKLLATLFLQACSVAIQVGVMIYGWGLQPKSWGWIIGMGCCAQMVVLIFLHIIRK